MEAVKVPFDNPCPGILSGREPLKANCRPSLGSGQGAGFPFFWGPLLAGRRSGQNVCSPATGPARLVKPAFDPGFRLPEASAMGAGAAGFAFWPCARRADIAPRLHIMLAALWPLLRHFGKGWIFFEESHSAAKLPLSTSARQKTIFPMVAQRSHCPALGMV